MKTVTDFKLETKVVSAGHETVGNISVGGRRLCDKISTRIDEDIKIRFFCLFLRDAWLNRRPIFQYEKSPDVHQQEKK